MNNIDQRWIDSNEEIHRLQQLYGRDCGLRFPTEILVNVIKSCVSFLNLFIHRQISKNLWEYRGRCCKFKYGNKLECELLSPGLLFSHIIQLLINCTNKKLNKYHS